MLGTADQQTKCRAHGAEVGAEVDDIGYDQQEDNRAQQPRRIMAPQIVCDTVTRHAADPCADRLNSGHQRKTEQHGPSESVTELGADLAVCSNAARVVVRCAGHQRRSKIFKKTG